MKTTLRHPLTTENTESLNAHQNGQQMLVEVRRGKNLYTMLVGVEINTAIMYIKFFKMKKKIGQAYDPAISLLGDENSTFYIEIFVNLSLLLLYLR